MTDVPGIDSYMLQALRQGQANFPTLKERMEALGWKCDVPFYRVLFRFASNRLIESGQVEWDGDDANPVLRLTEHYQNN